MINGGKPQNPLIPDDEQDDPKLKFYIKPLNSESAFNKGVEYGIEFFVLYGSIFAITAYEVNRNYQK